MRSGGACVSLQRAAEAASAIARAAEALGSGLTEVSEVARFRDRRELGDRGQAFGLETPSGQYDLQVGLGGVHQADNVALAITAAEHLAGAGWPKLDRRSIEVGVAACRWPARLEWVHLVEVTVLLDAAHNPAGVSSLAAYLRGVDRPYTLLFGMLRAKVDSAITGALWERAERVVLTTPPSDRALPPEELARLVGMGPDEIVAEPAAALDACLATAPPGLLVISGSIYLVGEMRAALRARFGRPESPEELFSR